MKKEAIKGIYLVLLVLVVVSLASGIYFGISGNVASEQHSIGPSTEEQACMMQCMGCSSPGVGCTGDQEQCMAQCNVKKPGQSQEEKCVESCVAQGCGEYDFECQSKNQKKCDEQCGMIKEPEAKSEEERCIRECVNKESPGLICHGGEGGEQGNEICRRCAKECEHLYAGPCLGEEKLEAKKKECGTCEHCYGQPVMGDSGEGYQCIVDVECKDASSEFGDEPGTGPGVESKTESEASQEGFVAKVGDTIGNVVEKIGNFFKNLF